MADKNRSKARSLSNPGSAGAMNQYQAPNGSGGGLFRSTDDLHYDVHKYLDQFWQYQTEKIEKMSPVEFRETKISQELPLARIKKIMKLDEDVKTQMISAEAPVLFAKACEMFIEELTIRAWVHTEDNKRKTLQKNDIAMAISKYDQFDFLIDIVPREEIMKTSGGGASGSPTGKRGAPSPGAAQAESQVPMFVQVATPAPSGIVAQPAVQAIQLQNGQIVQAQALGGGQPMQLVQGANGELQLVSIAGNSQPVAAQVLHTASIPQHQAQQHHHQEASSSQSSAPFAQAFQQVVASDGSIHHLPIQLSPAQMNYLKQHLNSGSGQQQVHVLQNAPTATVGNATVPVRVQTQQQIQQQPATAFFVQTSGPVSQVQQQAGVQLQMVSAEHQGSDAAISNAS